MIPSTKLAVALLFPGGLVCSGKVIAPFLKLGADGVEKCGRKD